MNILTVSVESDGKIVFDDIKSLVDLKCVVENNRYYFQIPKQTIKSAIVTLKSSDDILFPQVNCESGGLIVELKTGNGQLQKGNYVLWISHTIDPLGCQAQQQIKETPVKFRV